MKINDLMVRCLGGVHNTVSVERPINPGVPNEILYSGNFASVPSDIADMEFFNFSVNGKDNDLRADIVIYVS
jgi:hypothetical protein